MVIENGMRIQFCDLCNESVPQADLERGRAVRRKERVICANCEAAMSAAGESPAGAAPAPIVLVGESGGSAADTTIVETQSVAPLRPQPVRSSSSGTAVGVSLACVALVLTVGISGFLFQQLEERNAQLVAEISRSRDIALERSRALEDRLNSSIQAATAGVSAARRTVDDLDGRVHRLGETQQAVLADLESQMDRLQSEVASLGGVAAAVGTHEDGLAKVAEMAATLHADVLRIGDRLNDMEVAGGAAPTLGLQAAPEAQAPTWIALLEDLESQSSGKRWQAVQSLGATRDVAVAEHLVVMLKDPDIFVRMATARILGDLQAIAAIPALIDALEDPEASVREASVVSLRSITGRSFKFDPGEKEAERARRVRAWRDWWKKSGDELLGDV